MDGSAGSGRYEPAQHSIRLLGLLLAVTCFAASLWRDHAFAQAATDSTGFWQRSNLLGDMGGLRTLLGRHGITIGLQETSEVFANVTGGIRQGVAYDGVTQMGVGLDTQKAFGWEGGTFNVSALQIHGHSVTAENLLSLQTASGIEADRATRLWELWYQQAFLHGAADVKVGLQALDQEFEQAHWGRSRLGAPDEYSLLNFSCERQVDPDRCA